MKRNYATIYLNDRYAQVFFYDKNTAEVIKTKYPLYIAFRPNDIHFLDEKA